MSNEKFLSLYPCFLSFTVVVADGYYEIHSDTTSILKMKILLYSVYVYEPRLFSIRVDNQPNRSRPVALNFLIKAFET